MVPRAISVENVPGAGGLKGVERANALAAREEAVLLLGTPSTHVLLPARLGASAAPDRAFHPLAGLGSAPNVLLVSPRLAARSVEALVALARGEQLVYASAGAGQTIHVCTALFCRQAGIAMRHRPYEAGSAAAYDDLIAGRVHVHFDNLLGCRERVARGEAIALAVSSRRRSAFLPGVPTLAECGFPDHALDVWLGVFAAHVEPALEREATRRLGDLAGGLHELGLEAGPLDPRSLEAIVAASAAPWTRAIASISS